MEYNKVIILLATYFLFPHFVIAETENTSNEESQKRIQTVADVFDRPGVLTPKGQFVLDTSFNYSQNSSNKVSVVGYTILPTLIVGRIEVSDSDKTTITLGMAGRYGITNRLEAELRVPWVYRNDQLVTRPIQDGASDETEVVTIDGSAMGDIEAALRYQLDMESAPYWIGTIRVKSTTGKSPYDIDVDPNTNSLTDVPTGSGLWSVGYSISMIYPSDPAVLFMNLGYTYNIADIIGSGESKVKLDLGDTISLGAGMGFAVNPDFSFSLGLNHKTILKSKINDSTADNAQLLQLDTINFGANLAINDRLSVNVGVSAGLTEDSPDFQLTIRFPYSF